MSEIRRFTASGLAAARDCLNRLRQGEHTNVAELLVSRQHTILMASDLEYEVREFEDRQEAAEYFYNLLGQLESGQSDLELDDGLWTWLAFKWLDILAPADPENGLRAIMQTERYVLRPSDYQTYYRHYLSGPYRIYKAHRDDLASVRAVLATPVTSPGEVVEQIASKQDIISNSTLMKVVTKLYVDAATNRLKRGSGGRAGGSPRRLSDVLYQFDQTWDTAAMNADEVLQLLPEEFERFKAN